MTDGERYAGSELELFRDAKHWKSYIAAQIEPFIVGDVLEVGAGLGGTTEVLHRGNCRSWTCLEPDGELAAKLRRGTLHLRDQRGKAPIVETGTMATLDQQPRFDCILYIDVLEHISDDRGELATATRRLRSGGFLIVLSPARQWLYTPFDRAIGHHRRYDRRALEACAPADTRLVTSRYLDAVGIGASLANRLLMRQAMPSRAQIRFWDRWLVPLSRRLDALLRFRLGKSILVVWQRQSG